MASALLGLVRRWGRHGVVLAAVAALLVYLRRRKLAGAGNRQVQAGGGKAQVANSQFDNYGFQLPVAASAGGGGAAAPPAAARPSPVSIPTMAAAPTSANYTRSPSAGAPPFLNYTRGTPVSLGYTPNVDTRGIPSEVSLEMITSDSSQLVRKTKVVCTLGPACWSEEGLAALLDAGCNVGRLNFSHGDHPGHQEVLDRFRAVCAQKGSTAGILVDTKGPEIRTAMLRGGKDIELDAGQQVTVFAAGDSYTSFEGYKDPVTGETVVGCSYAALARTVKPGDRMLFADGSVVFLVEEILDDKNVRCTCLNSKTLGQRKNGNLPGVKVDLPVLMDKDINDLQNFACRNKVDFVAISFVQTGEDVQFVRRILNEAGGQRIKIICKIENEAGVINFDEILKHTDGIMVARGDLGMEMPSEKIPLAQKWMISKCNQAGKFCVTATQMLESMVGNPLPTRAEMTDVANAVFDGSDCTMLSGETAGGADPTNACATMARIAATAEIACDYAAYSRDISSKVAARTKAESTGLEVATMARDSSISLVICLSDNENILQGITKCRPAAPVVVVTTSAELARFTGCLFGVFPCLVDGRADVTVEAGVTAARALSLVEGYGAGSAVLVDQNLAVTVHRYR
jgi:pyruvate kinase